jgi:methenyltetrahydrofolate cyclohydrolase
MNNKIADQKVSEFLEDLASKSPTPGGGAVAALVGSMAASLCLMVIRLTKEDLGSIEKILTVLQSKLLALADSDVLAFNEVIRSYREKDKDRIQKALKRATEVPLETMQLASQVKEYAEELIEKGNKNAYSDAKSASFLAEAAKKSAFENVEINLKLIIDEDWKKKIKALCDVI